MSYPKTRKYSLCIPAESSQHNQSYKKHPPWLIKISTSKDTLNSQRVIKTIIPETSSSMSTTKHFSETLPPITINSRGRSNKHKLFSPKYQINYKNLKPLFTKKKKVDQSLSTRMDESWELENPIENTYKISVITKKVM
jgi:hypothetical protein